MTLISQRLRSRGGKGVICPPWNFQTHLILPSFAQKRHKLGHFHEILGTLPPPEFENLRKRFNALLALQIFAIMIKCTTNNFFLKELKYFFFFCLDEYYMLSSFNCKTYRPIFWSLQSIPMMKMKKRYVKIIV